jgi:hypothetical protein
VILRTAISSVRSPNCSSRRLSFQKKSFLTVVLLSHRRGWGFLAVSRGGPFAG